MIASFITLIKKNGLLLILGALSGFLYAVCMPPEGTSELAFVFAIPLLLAALREFSNKAYNLIALLSMVCAWLFLIFWLRHVTVMGWILLGCLMGSFTALWFICTRIYIKWVLLMPALPRLAGLLGITGGWILLEWARGHFLTGFPWLPLAASQVNHPLLLSPLAYIGTLGLSGILIFFNLALLSYGWGLLNRPSAKGRLHFPIELYAAILVFFGMGYLFFKSLPKKPAETTFRAGIVQPYTPALLKWDPTTAKEQYKILEDLSLSLALEPTDVIFWPEAATPTPMLGHISTQQWGQRLANTLECPLCAGTVVFDGLNYANSLIVMEPKEGILRPIYTKRHLVPFGEYVPNWAKWIVPWLQKVVPLPGDSLCGQSPALIPLSVRKETYLLGGLICYEDIFPALARESTLAGADLFVVVTNNAWYGEERGAPQHFAHSILRAAETHRPVIRCGNAGQSGWIDELGRTRETLIHAQNGPYFRGTGVLAVAVDPHFRGTKTLYVREGDWILPFFVLLTLCLMALHRLTRLKGTKESTTN